MCQRNQRKLEALRRSQEIECSVCLERVLAKAKPSERKFGILSHCDHPHCIACIRGWRAAGSQGEATGLDLEGAVRACPVCRVQSHFVTPSVVWYFSPQEKEDIVNGYKRRLRYAGAPSPVDPPLHPCMRHFSPALRPRRDLSAQGEASGVKV